MHPNPRRIMPVVLILAALSGLVYWYFAARSARAAAGTLMASGTIVTTQVNIAPELAGRVTEVLVEEGQVVKADEPLLKLDPSLLSAQREAAAASVEAARAAYASAQAQFNIAETAARAQARASRLSDWAGKTPDYFNQPKWYFTQAEQIAAAEAEVQAAEAEVEARETNLAAVVSDLKNEEFLEAETRLSNARSAYLVARQVQAEGQAVGQGNDPSALDLDTLNIQIPPGAPGYRVRIHVSQLLPNQQMLYDASQDAYDAASIELSEAQAAYDALLSSASAENVLRARAQLSVAIERRKVALDRLSGLQTGEYSLQVKAAAAALNQAQSAVEQAQANLDLIDIQMRKLTVKAPIDGVVLSRSIEVGESVQPGSVALVLGELDEQTITVYVPEDRYGEISVGQRAEVRVDSFPEAVFMASVIQIADQAEFTPRNVQTAEGRRNTVFAIRLRIDEPDERLKPGMPADVIFK